MNNYADTEEFLDQEMEKPYLHGLNQGELKELDKDQLINLLNNYVEASKNHYFDKTFKPSNETN